MTRDEAIAEITLRLVEYYHPERVFCFGSQAQDDFVPWHRSDFDARAMHVNASPPAAAVREGRLRYDSRPVAA